MELASSGAICTCVGYFVAVKEPSPAVFVLLFSLSQFFGSFCLSSCESATTHCTGLCRAFAMQSSVVTVHKWVAALDWANILDIAPRYAACVVGVSNTIASLPGVFGNLIAGLLLQYTGSWQLVFAVSVGVQAAGCAVYCVWARGDVVVK